MYRNVDSRTSQDPLLKARLQGHSKTILALGAERRGDVQRPRKAAGGRRGYADVAVYSPSRSNQTPFASEAP